MASPAYGWLKDEQGIQLKGSTTIKGREGSVEIVAFKHAITIPTDRDTGVLTGTRKHEALVFSKNFCPLTPILNKACCSGKTLKEFKISWYRMDGAGNEKEYFRQTLSQVRIVAVRPVLHHVKDEEKDRYMHEEEIALRYDKIRWEYLDGNIATEDDWNRKSSL